MSPEELAEIEKAAHKSGDAHEYSLTCKVCGQPGVIRLTIDPQHDHEAHLSYEALSAKLAAAERRAGLDTERLARAIARIAERGPHSPDEAEEHWESYRKEAEDYAREYAALATHALDAGGEKK